MADKIKLVAAVLSLIVGVVGYYLLAEQPIVLRVVSVFAGVIVGCVLGWSTVPGKEFHAFGQDSIAEARKVVWPTRKESLQMTGIVFVFVLLMAVFLWAVDGSLFFVVQKLMGNEG